MTRIAKESPMSIKTNTSLEEYERRSEKMRQYMAEHKLDGLCIFGAVRTFYLSGFHHLPTERPVVLVLPLRGEMALMVPHLEEANIPVRTPHIKEVKVYREYPGDKHPMLHLAELLQEKGLADKSLGVDGEGWGGGHGYRGPALSKVVPNAKLTNVRDAINEMRMVKSEEELELIRLSAQFGNVAHGLLQDYVEVGVSELEISLRTLTDATAYMVKALGQEWEPSGGRGPFAGLAGITSGPKTAFGHRRPGARKVQKGDVLLTYASAEVGGYVTELERMFIVGPPTDQHEKYFDLEVQVQDVAFAAIRPGVRCCDVEKAVNAFLEEHDLYRFTVTHVGHGIGIEGHEAPFFDLGDETVLEPGMVMTVEPCLLIPGYAGFRHSDTVVVTEDGMKMITYYPRDLDSLIVHV
jgi:Xaa-Pro dipeptidase